MGNFFWTYSEEEIISEILKKDGKITYESLPLSYKTKENIVFAFLS